jgi:hypothetical protein
VGQDDDSDLSADTDTTWDRDLDLPAIDEDEAAMATAVGQGSRLVTAVAMLAWLTRVCLVGAQRRKTTRSRSSRRRVKPTGTLKSNFTFGKLASRRNRYRVDTKTGASEPPS